MEKPGAATRRPTAETAKKQLATRKFRTGDRLFEESNDICMDISRKRGIIAKGILPRNTRGTQNVPKYQRKEELHYMHIAKIDKHSGLTNTSTTTRDEIKSTLS